MKERNELNRRLYLQKMYGEVQPHSGTEKYAAVRSGDPDSISRQNYSEITTPFTEKLSDDLLKNTMYSFVISAYETAGACMENGMGLSEAYTLAAIYIRKADICSDKGGLLEIYRQMQLDFAERMHEIKKNDVISFHVRKCIDYIYENPDKDLSVKALAKLAGLDPSYFSRLFAKETGTTVKKFVTAARIDISENLLKYSELSYSEISHALSFSSQSAFISVFRKTTGITPKQYRDRYYQTSQKVKD